MGLTWGGIDSPFYRMAATDYTAAASYEDNLGPRLVGMKL